MKIVMANVADLSGFALDWFAAKCWYSDGRIVRASQYGFIEVANSPETDAYFHRCSLSTDWAQGGPILEKEGIGTVSQANDNSAWVASLAYARKVFRLSPIDLVYSYCTMRGPTPLVAGMRCFIVSRLGDKVIVPQELL